jgi:hypothetical protein
VKKQGYKPTKFTQAKLPATAMPAGARKKMKKGKK